MVVRERFGEQWSVKTYKGEKEQWRSKHIDFLITDGNQYIAVELKTDNASISKPQLRYYDDFIHKKWSLIRHDINELMVHSIEKNKYNFLLKCLCGEDKNEVHKKWKLLDNKDSYPACVIYIQPNADDKLKKESIDKNCPWRKVLTFDEIISHHDDSDPIWEAFLECLKASKSET